jgi:hypothetical protein
MKARFRTIPTLNDLQLLGPISLGLDVLLVDTNKDKNLVKLQHLARVLVKGIGINIPLMIKKLAELVKFLALVPWNCLISRSSLHIIWSGQDLNSALWTWRVWFLSPGNLDNQVLDSW